MKRPTSLSPHQTPSITFTSSNALHHIHLMKRPTSLSPHQTPYITFASSNAQHNLHLVKLPTSLSPHQTLNITFTSSNAQHHIHAHNKNQQMELYVASKSESHGHINIFTQQTSLYRHPVKTYTLKKHIHTLTPSCL